MAELTIRAITTPEHEIASKLIATIFKNQPADDYVSHFASRPSMIGVPFRALFHKKQMVSIAHIVDFSLRYGRAKLKVVGLALIGTHPSFRGRGYATALIKDTLTYSAEVGAHLVLLNTQTGQFYQQFGFSPVWAKYTLQFPSDQASQLNQPYQLRIATPSDLSAMERLYNNFWGTRVTIERSHELWRWRMAHSRGQSAVVIDKTGKIRGYIWHPPDSYSDRVEVVVADRDALLTVLAYTGRRWQSANQQQVIWSVPPDDVIILYLQQILPITLSASFFPSAGWMARVIDSGSMLNEILPEIIAQAKTTYADFDANQLTLKIEPDGVSIGFRSMPDSHCHLSQRDFIQLLFGSLRPQALAVRQPLSRQSIDLLNLLFPSRITAIAAWDWY